LAGGEAGTAGKTIHLDLPVRIQAAAV
jgi:hypothetical protein